MNIESFKKTGRDKTYGGVQKKKTREIEKKINFTEFFNESGGVGECVW